MNRESEGGWRHPCCADLALLFCQDVHTVLARMQNSSGDLVLDSNSSHEIFHISKSTTLAWTPFSIASTSACEIVCTTSLWYAFTLTSRLDFLGILAAGVMEEFSLGMKGRRLVMNEEGGWEEFVGTEVKG